MRFDKTILLPLTIKQASILLKYMITFTPEQEHQEEIFNLTEKLRSLCDETKLD